MKKATAVPDGLLAPSDDAAPTEMPDIERQHVQRVYDSIAAEWHGTRYRSWPRVEEFVFSLPRGSLVADLGCGNGKMASACRQGGHFALACDFSVELVRIAALQQGAEAQVADALAVPYREGRFDAALSIAVLHHISTDARRRQLIAETLRVLRPGGLALFYAWAMEQSNGRSGHSFASQDVFVPFHQRAHTPAKQPTTKGKGGGGSDSGAGEPAATEPATAAAADASQAAAAAAPAVHQRYCHVYREHELRRLAEDVPGAVVMQEYYDTGNHCLLLRKAGGTDTEQAAALGDQGEPSRCGDGRSMGRSMAATSACTRASGGE